MICPNCGKVMRFSDAEKKEIKRLGSMVRPCFWCGEKHEISANDVRLRKKEPSRRALRLSQGLCADCGARPPMEGYTFCERCKSLRDKHRAMTSSPWKEMEEMNEKERLAKKKKGMTLDEISAAAYKEGISYGEYVAKYKL